MWFDEMLKLVPRCCLSCRELERGQAGGKLDNENLRMGTEASFIVAEAKG